MKVFSSLTNRIFVATAALSVLCISAAIYLVNARVNAAAHDELLRDLNQTAAAVDEQRATASALFAVLARTVADLPKLKAAVDTDDPPTVQPIAADYRRDVHADLFLVDGRSGRQLAAIVPPGVETDFRTAATPPRDAVERRETRSFVPAGNALMETISVPITAGPEPTQTVGTLTLGFLLDDRVAARFSKLTGSEIAFATGGRVVASTLHGQARHAVEQILPAVRLQEVSIGGEDYLAMVRPLDAPLQPSLFGSGATIQTAAVTAADRPAVIVLRSRADALHLLRAIQTALVAMGFVAVLLAIVLSYGIARTITRPLAAITAVMKQMAATGDLTRKIDWQPNRWEDEDAQLLARTFNTLTGSITKFQREAAERERLSALGRLSTVIAHEVRNPLMIIKASLRPLMQGTATTSDVREAAADIDEEVARLNRLVNDVLDFARPPKFDVAPTDINDLCRASAAAATTGFPSVSVRLTLDPALPRVVTDGERLRATLVNIVANACDAVATRPNGAAGSSSPGGPDVELKTIARGADGFSIFVKDRGVGIDTVELGRVFDPYFTTKRGGTGLGLAISRNIIEGLGGTIHIESERGKGTEVRIDLPVRQPS